MKSLIFNSKIPIEIFRTGIFFLLSVDEVIVLILCYDVLLQKFFNDRILRFNSITVLLVFLRYIADGVGFISGLVVEYEEVFSIFLSPPVAKEK